VDVHRSLTCCLTDAKRNWVTFFQDEEHKTKRARALIHFCSPWPFQFVLILADKYKQTVHIVVYDVSIPKALSIVFVIATWQEGKMSDLSRGKYPTLSFTDTQPSMATASAHNRLWVAARNRHLLTLAVSVYRDERGKLEASHPVAEAHYRPNTLK